MLIKLTKKDDYIEERKKFKNTKINVDEVDCSFLFDGETPTIEEVEEWKKFNGGDKFYLEIPDDETAYINELKYAEMNALEFEIWVAKNFDGDNAEVFDELFANEKFMKYRNKKFPAIIFYSHQGNGADEWNEGTPIELQKEFQKEMAMIRSVISKYANIMIN